MESTPLASTLTSDVFKVQFYGNPAVLKIFNSKGKQFEARGAIVLRYFAGRGAVTLLNSDEGAHLLEFVEGPNLKGLVAQGDDNKATEIICEVVDRLHSQSGKAPDGLINMECNFHSLFLQARKESKDSIYVAGACLAEKLIRDEQEVRVLHGDIHHENILQSSNRGWLAIDPQCLVGERTYDLANTFYNPMGSQPAECEEIIERRTHTISRTLRLDRRRLLEYAFAYGCLRSAWYLEDGQDADSTLRIAHKVGSLLKNL